MKKSSHVLRLGLLGLGTVGQSVIKLLECHGEEYTRRAGRRLELVSVSARTRDRARSVDITPYRWYDDPCAMALAEDVDAVIEVIGGQDTAAMFARGALDAGKPWITANKALLAEQGRDLLQIAEQKQVKIGFEAAVCGAIPIVKILREALAANRVDWVQGIFNGTCNYIAAEMAAGATFDAALADAQAKGYAEADPTLDIGGGDAAHKAALMAGLLSGGAIDFSKVHVEGIDALPPGLMAKLRGSGYVLKLLGRCALAGDSWAVWVYPALLAEGHPLARISGVQNAVCYCGDAAGSGMAQGPGAGGDATASSVLADVLDIAAGRGVVGGGLSSATTTRLLPVSERVGDYLIFEAGGSLGARLDRAGVVIEDVGGSRLRVRNVREADLQRFLSADGGGGFWLRIEGGDVG